MFSQTVVGGLYATEQIFSDERWQFDGLSADQQAALKQQNDKWERALEWLRQAVLLPELEWMAREWMLLVPQALDGIPESSELPTSFL